MDKKNYIVTVVIVTFNAEKTLQACLNSIYEQTAGPIEIIVMDGASTDSTTIILKENSASISFWKSEPDSGIYDAMNKALPHISSPRVIFLGADDRLLPGFSQMLSVLSDSSAIYYGNVLYKGEPHSGLISPYYQAKLGIFHQSIIYPSSVFSEYTYNVKYKIAADYALNMRLYKDKKYTFQYLDYLISDYNDTGISAVLRDELFERDKSRIILQNFGLKIWSRYIFRVLKSKFKKGKS